MKSFFSIALLMGASMANKLSLSEEDESTSAINNDVAMANIALLTDATMDMAGDMDTGASLPSIDGDAIPDITDSVEPMEKTSIEVPDVVEE